MLYRNIFILTILFFCSSAHCAENNPKNSFYFKGSYFGVFGNVMNDLSGKEDAGDVTEGIISFSTDEEIVEGYKPKYTAGLVGGGAIGYSLNEMQLSSKFIPSRVELEILYSQVNLDDEDYINKSSKDMAQKFALFRNNATSIHDGGFSYSLRNPLNHPDATFDYAVRVEHVNEKRAIFTIENSGFNNVAAMVNTYYDLNLNPYIVQYIGGGLGPTKVKFLGRSKHTLAFQLKAGVHYALNDKMQMFAGLRYFGIVSNQFKNILPIVKIVEGDVGTDHYGDDYDDSARVASTTATINHRFGVYGLEVGMAYNF